MTGLDAHSGNGADGPRRDAVVAAAAGAEPAPGLDLIAVRQLLVGPIVARVDLTPGDRALVGPGEPVIAGAPLAERLRDVQLGEAPALAGDDPRRPGDRLTADLSTGRTIRRAASAAGELVFRSGRRWRVATGEMADPIEAPTAGIVREVRTGTGLTIELAGTAMPAAFAIGVPSRGRLAIAMDAAGELRATGVDVGRADTIVVAGARIDAETLTRARAMGVRGVVVASLSGKELRDFGASERRQRAALHRLTPFAVLVLDGVVRRPIPARMMTLLESLAGREVGIVIDPPALIVPGDPPTVPAQPPDRVRVRHGARAGAEGRFLAAVGPRRFPPGVHLEAGLVELDGGASVAVPLADLERLV